MVYVLSTSRATAMKNTNKVGTDGNAIQKPAIIIDYNHNMGDVHLVDEQLDSLDELRKPNDINFTRHKEGRMISFPFFKRYAPYFFRMHQEWKEILPELP